MGKPHHPSGKSKKQLYKEGKLNSQGKEYTYHQNEKPIPPEGKKFTKTKPTLDTIEQDPEYKETLDIIYSNRKKSKKHTPQSVTKDIDDYFESLKTEDVWEKQVSTKHGIQTIKLKTPATIEGLCDFIGWDYSDLFMWIRHPHYTTVLSRAMMRIKRRLLEGGLLGVYNPLIVRNINEAMIRAVAELHGDAEESDDFRNLTNEQLDQVMMMRQSIQDVISKAKDQKDQHKVISEEMRDVGIDRSQEDSDGIDDAEIDYSSDMDRTTKEEVAEEVDANKVEFDQPPTLDEVEAIRARRRSENQD